MYKESSDIDGCVLWSESYIVSKSLHEHFYGRPCLKRDPTVDRTTLDRKTLDQNDT